MVQINFAQKTVTVKIVYYGPGMSGKTTNLEIVHQRAPDSNRGDLTSISTDGDRTLFFDFMPLDLGTVAGMRTQFQIYTVPGQVYYNSTRKLVLQGVDGVIFIADSSASMLQENLESLSNLEENLAEYGKSLDSMPYVIQYNKRDLPDAMPVPDLEATLNPRGAPSFEGIANTGQGVFPTLKALAAKVLDMIHAQQGGGGAPAPAAAAPAPQAAPAPPVQAGNTGFYPGPGAPQPPQVAPPVQTAGTGFYPAQGGALPEPPPVVPAAHTPAPVHAPPVHARAAAPTPPPVQAPAPGYGVAPQPPANAPAPPQAMAAPTPAQQRHEPASLRMAHPPLGTAPAAGPAHGHPVAPPAAPAHPQFGAAPAPGAPALGQTQHGFSAPTMGTAPRPQAAPAHAAQAPRAVQTQGAKAHAAKAQAARLKPRAATALPTPKNAGRKSSTFFTGVLVAVALAAGVVVGSLVFKLF